MQSESEWCNLSQFGRLANCKPWPSRFQLSPSIDPASSRRRTPTLTVMGPRIENDTNMNLNVNNMDSELSSVAEGFLSNHAPEESSRSGRLFLLVDSVQHLTKNIGNRLSLGW